MKRTEIAPILALVPCLALAACAQQPEQQEETPAMEEMSEATDMQAFTAAMDQLQTAWKTAYEAGDVATLASLYAQDAIYMAPYMDAIRGRAAIQARLAETMGMATSRQITIQRTDHGVSGDQAFGLGTYAVEMQMEGAEGPVTDNGKYITVARRAADGSWKIYAHIWNTSLPEAQVAEMLSSMNM